MDNIEEITFGDFNFNPRDVKWDDLEPGLILSFKADLPTERHEDLVQFYKNHDDYFKVVINGDESRTMRVGRPFYSSHDEITKYHIILVSKEYDDNVNGDRVVHDSDPNMRDIIAFNNAYIEQLENILVDKGILNQDEVQTLKTKSEENISDKKFEFGKLDDVDKYAS